MFQAEEQRRFTEGRLVKRELKHSPKFLHLKAEWGDNIQGDAGRNDNNVGGDIIGRCEEKVRRNICLILNGYRDRVRNECQDYFVAYRRPVRKADNLTTILCRCHEIWEP